MGLAGWKDAIQVTSGHLATKGEMNISHMYTSYVHVYTYIYISMKPAQKKAEAKDG